MTKQVLLAGAWVLAALLVAGCCCRRPVCGDKARAVSPAGDKREVWIDLTTLRVPEDRVASVLGGVELPTAQRALELTDVQARALWARVRADDTVRVLRAPKVLAIEGQVATISVGEMVRFARTKAATNESGGLTFSIEEDPDGPVSLGFQARVVARPTADGRRIALALTASETWLSEPIPNPAAVGAVAHREKVAEHEQDLSIDMRSGGHVLLVGAPAYVEDREGRALRLSIVTASVLGITPD